MGTCAELCISDPVTAGITEHKNALPWLKPLDSAIHHGGGVYRAFERKGASSLSRLDGCVGRGRKAHLGAYCPAVGR